MPAWCCVRHACEWLGTDASRVGLTNMVTAAATPEQHQSAIGCTVPGELGLSLNPRVAGSTPRRPTPLLWEGRWKARQGGQNPDT